MAIDQVQTASPLYGAGAHDELLRRKPQTYWGMALQSLRRDKLTIAALSFLLMAMILAGVLSYTRALGTEDLV